MFFPVWKVVNFRTLHLGRSQFKRAPEQVHGWGCHTFWFVALKAKIMQMLNVSERSCTGKVFQRVRVGLNRFFHSSQSSSQFRCITSGSILRLNVFIDGSAIFCTLGRFCSYPCTLFAIKNGFVQPDSILSHITHRLRIHNILFQVLLLSKAQF